MKAEHRLKADHGAEHRKELRTNALADRMGRFMQTVRQRPQGKTLWIWVGIIAVIIGLFVWWGWSRARRNENSMLWSALYNTRNGSQGLDAILKDYKDFKQADVANLEYHFDFLWDNQASIEIDVKNPKGGSKGKKIGILCGIANLKTVLKQQNAEEVYQGQRNLFMILENVYTKMYEKVKDDPQLGPETLYNVFVVQETLAVFNLEKLKAAKETLKDLVKNHANSGPGALAKQRLEEFYDNTANYKELREFYDVFGEDARKGKQIEDDGG